MPERLQRITIDGYKSIKHAEVELSALNVLIGANGAGKSNFISVFRLLNAIIEKRLQVFSAQERASTMFYNAKASSRIKIQLRLESHWYESRFSMSNSGTLNFEDEEFFFIEADKSAFKRYILGNGHQETNLYSQTLEERGEVKSLINSIINWKIYHFHDTSRNAPVKMQGDVNDNRFFRPDASNLAAFLYYLQEKQPFHFDRIVKTIRLVAPFFDTFTLEPLRLDPSQIRLEWRDRSSDTLFDAHALSDGTLRFICLATLLLQPDLPSVVLIDEPELGLHPFAIQILADLLKGAASQTQVIVSTQSVPLVNQFAPEDILVVDRIDGQSTFRRLDSASLSDWLEEYRMGELWEKNILGGRPQRETSGT